MVPAYIPTRNTYILRSGCSNQCRCNTRQEKPQLSIVYEAKHKTGHLIFLSAFLILAEIFEAQHESRASQRYPVSAFFASASLFDFKQT